MQHSTALNETQMSVLRLVGYVLCCTTCGHKSLHEGGFEYISRRGSRDGLLMYFEDGSVVQRLPIELTAAGQGPTERQLTPAC